MGTFGISRDITKRKRAEEALAERTQQLQKKNQQIEEEMKMARELQLAMLPQKFPAVPPNRPPQESALKFFSFFLPSGTVSGDFFDVVALSDTSVGVFICDVMGHDVRAALVTAMIRALVEDLSLGAADPGAPAGPDQPRSARRLPAGRHHHVRHRLLHGRRRGHGRTELRQRGPSGPAATAPQRKARWNLWPPMAAAKKARRSGCSRRRNSRPTGAG